MRGNFNTPDRVNPINMKDFVQLVKRMREARKNGKNTKELEKMVDECIVELEERMEVPMPVIIE